MRSSILNRSLLFFTFVVAVVALVLLAKLNWQVYGLAGWRDEVSTLASLKATREAIDDFHAGHLRLYRLGGEQERAQFTGETNGIFEIWNLQFYPELGEAHRYSKEQFIEYYNRKMQHMYSHPDKFSRDEEEVQESATNSNQSVRSDAN